tara:strand:+ start:3799 stop:4395 length:597 start_codon:yes stop_codon:yes gene_type:complete
MQYKFNNPIDRVFGCTELRSQILDFNFFKVGSFDELTELAVFYLELKLCRKTFKIVKDFTYLFKNHVFYEQLVNFMKLQKEANKLNAFKKKIKKGQLVPTCSQSFGWILLQQCGFSGYQHLSLKSRVSDIALMKSMPRHNEKRSKKIEKFHKMLEKCFNHLCVEEEAGARFLHETKDIVKLTSFDSIYNRRFDLIRNT